jgi:hypothetical protein
LSGSSPLTCLAWEPLPIAYATASRALDHNHVNIIFPSHIQVNNFLIQIITQWSLSHPDPWVFHTILGQLRNNSPVVATQIFIAALSLLLLSLLSPFCRVFTIIYLKQTMPLGYTVLQLFCMYSWCYTQCYFTHEISFVLLHQQHFL